MTNAKTHQSELERLEALEKRAETGGGPKAVERHHQRGKLTARERLALLFDRGSFVEVNKLAEIVAGVALAGELSLGAAISSLDWVSSHEKYGRNR